MKGLEPPRRKTLDPKSSAATNYATSAFSSAKLGKVFRLRFIIFELMFFEAFLGVVIYGICRYGAWLDLSAAAYMSLAENAFSLSLLNSVF